MIQKQGEKMKKYLLILMAVLVLFGIFGCSGINTGGEKQIVKYDIELSQVRKASDITQRYHAPVADTTMGQNRYAYEDDLMRSIWSCSEAGWEVVFYNKSEKPVIIDWNDVVYYDVDKIGHTVLASGTKYADRNEDQDPSLITRRGNITESLVSATHIYQSPMSGSLVKRPLFPVDYSEAVRYKNKEFKLMIPFTVDGLSAQYEFVFTIKNVTQELSTSNPWSGYLLDRALGVNF